MTKKNYILDTSVYLSDAMSIYSFKNNDIIIPLKVLEEIDRHKGRQDGVGTNARQIIRILDSLRSQGNLNKGVKLGKATHMPDLLNQSLYQKIMTLPSRIIKL